MKKALLLAGLFLCASGIYAEEKSVNTVADGKKRTKKPMNGCWNRRDGRTKLRTGEKNNPQQTQQDTAALPSRKAADTNG